MLCLVRLEAAIALQGRRSLFIKFQRILNIHKLSVR